MAGGICSSKELGVLGKRELRSGGSEGKLRGHFLHFQAQRELDLEEKPVTVQQGSENATPSGESLKCPKKEEGKA